MALGIRQPILVGGLTLTAGAWMVNWIHPGAIHAGESLLWGAIAVGSGLWWMRQSKSRSLDLFAAAPVLDRASVEQSLAQVDAWLQRLHQEVELNQPPASALGALREQLIALRSGLDRQTLRLAIAGAKTSGKTTLAQHLSPVSGSDATFPYPMDIIDLPTDAAPSSDLAAADLVLFLVTGDLTDSDLTRLKQLQQDQHRILLTFNKSDHYLPDERPLILQQIRERVLGLVPVQDVVAIAAAPACLKVRQHQSDGTVQERLEQPTADLTALTERLDSLGMAAIPALVLATTDRQARHLTAAVKAELHRLRRDRALPLIEQAQWIAAAAAFATPIPSLDLVATASVTAQLVMDLGGVYRQKLSLDQAKTIATTLAETMVKLGLVEVTSQAIAPLLKSHALTFVAGGAVQGVSAAYFTRMAGLSLVEYFEEQETLEDGDRGLHLDRLAQKLKAIFQETQRSAFAQTLVNQALQRLKPASGAPLVAAEIRS